MSTTRQREPVASHRIADSLREEILRGVHPPGTRLLQEDVAEQFHSSRLPVREAFRMLESDGLVTIVANTGAWISSLSLSECEEMYQIRERIEPLLLGFSLPGLTETVLARLGALVAAMEAAPDTESFLLLDREFHMLSYSGANTVMLGSTVERLWNTTQHYRRAFTNVIDPQTSLAVHAEHRLLVDALRRADPEGAGQVLHGHIRRTRLELERHPDIFK